MKLNMICVGGHISFNHFKTILERIKHNSTLTLENAHLLPRQPLLETIHSAEQVKLALNTTAKGISSTDLETLINITRAKTSVSIEDINDYSAVSIPPLLASIGNKDVAVSIDGKAVSQITAPPLVSALIKTKTQLHIGSLTSMADSAAYATLEALGARQSSLEIDAKVATPIRSASTLMKISKQSKVTITNSDTFSTSFMPNLAEAISDRQCTIQISAPRFNLQQLKTFIPILGENTTIAIDSAHLYQTKEILEIFQLAGNRHLSLKFNGRQMSVDPVNGNKLLETVNAASQNHTILVNTAQSAALAYLLPAVSSSQHTNLVLQYKGSQITDTTANGNVVVRGIEASSQATQIEVNSVGVQNFRLENYLDIVDAAG